MLPHQYDIQVYLSESTINCTIDLLQKFSALLKLSREAVQTLPEAQTTDETYDGNPDA